MYSNKENVNILSALMVEHGITKVIVCPGSRNSPLVHNFNECPDIDCFPVTDERSAAFYALGMAQTLSSSVAVCVTSGSALLNTAPAIAEAAYQHLPLLIISADRPAEWIGQMDGQTMPQTNVFPSFAKKEVSLPEPHDCNTRWLCNRLVNEALLSLAEGPVHINVPISEPIFTYDVPDLPKERVIRRAKWDLSIMSPFKRIMVVLGQLPPMDIPSDLHDKVAVLSEPVSSKVQSYTDAMLCRINHTMDPDAVVYIGGNTISKRLRNYLRSISAFQIVCADDLHDVSCNTGLFISVSASAVLNDLCTLPDSEYAACWRKFREETAEIHNSFIPDYSGLLAARLLEESLPKHSKVFYANSMAIRYAEIYAGGYRYCNRGLNGIEGSVSAAAGASLVSSSPVYLITGDLSFLYDSNALWQNNRLRNLRIMVINNNGGAIFETLPGKSPALPYISGNHTLSLENISKQFGAAYIKATDISTLKSGIESLTTAESDTPIILEMVTDSKEDAHQMEKYYKHLI